MVVDHNPKYKSSAADNRFVRRGRGSGVRFFEIGWQQVLSRPRGSARGRTADAAPPHVPGYPVVSFRRSGLAFLNGLRKMQAEPELCDK